MSEDAAARSLARADRVKKLLFVLGLLLLVVLAFAMVCLLGYRLFLMPTTDDGTCFVFDKNHCSSLSESRVEEAADVEIPGGSTITDSDASRFLKIGRQTALIQLPENGTLGLGHGYLNETSSDMTSGVSSYLAEHGIRDIDSIVVDAERGSTVYFAHDDNGTQWAYVSVVWDG